MKTQAQYKAERLFAYFLGLWIIVGGWMLSAYLVAVLFNYSVASYFNLEDITILEGGCLYLLFCILAITVAALTPGALK